MRARVCVCGQGVLDAYGGKAHGEEERKEREKNKEKRAGTTGRRDERREKRGKRRRRKEDGGKKTEEILSGFTCAENAPNIGARKYKKRHQNDYSSYPLFRNCCFHIHFVVWSNSTGCHS